MPYCYGETVKGQLLQLVHDVCSVELGVSMHREHTTIQWTGAKAAYPGFLALNPVVVKYLPKRREGSFMVPEAVIALDGGDTQIQVVSRSNEDLNDDPYSAWVLEEARAIFNAHDHGVCIDIAIEMQQQEEARKTRLVTVRGTDGTILLD